MKRYVEGESHLVQEKAIIACREEPEQQHGKKTRLQKGWTRFRSQIYLQGMAIPGIIWLIVFCYIPMYGIVIAFRDYRVGSGFFAGAWVGLKHFEAFFADRFAIEAIWNTLIISALKLVVGFPAPILLALLLNEIRSTWFKKIIQSVSYLPYFISWVVMVALLKTLVGVDGPMNDLLVMLGVTDSRIAFLTVPEYFRPIAVLSDLWKGIGWSSILYIAAISSISQEMYESAYMDGASRLQRAWYITLPSILPTIVIMLILAVSGILGSNFDQHLLLGNPQNLQVASTIDTYVYSIGLGSGRYSFATAISLSRSVISFFLLFAADRLARMLTRGAQGLF